jgi:hypothetical protein
VVTVTVLHKVTVQMSGTVTIQIVLLIRGEQSVAATNSRAAERYRRLSNSEFSCFEPYGGGSFAGFRRQLLRSPHTQPLLLFPFLPRAALPPATAAALRLYRMPCGDVEATRGKGRVPLGASTRAASQAQFVSFVSCWSAAGMPNLELLQSPLRPWRFCLFFCYNIPVRHVQLRGNQESRRIFTGGP